MPGCPGMPGCAGIPGCAGMPGGGTSVDVGTGAGAGGGGGAGWAGAWANAGPTATALEISSAKADRYSMLIGSFPCCPPEHRWPGRVPATHRESRMTLAERGRRVRFPDGPLAAGRKSGREEGWLEEARPGGARPGGRGRAEPAGGAAAALSDGGLLGARRRGRGLADLGERLAQILDLDLDGQALQRARGELERAGEGDQVVVLGESRARRPRRGRRRPARARGGDPPRRRRGTRRRWRRGRASPGRTPGAAPRSPRSAIRRAASPSSSWTTARPEPGAADRRARRRAGGRTAGGSGRGATCGEHTAVLCVGSARLASHHQSLPLGPRPHPGG